MATNEQNRQSIDQGMTDTGDRTKTPLNKSGKAMAKDGYSVLDRKEVGRKERDGLADRHYNNSYYY